MKRATWRWSALVAAALAVAGSACDEGPTEVPVPGALVVALTTPNADDGAILFSITGGPVGTPAAAAPSHHVFYRTIDASTTKVAVVGNLAPGAILRLDVPDVRRAGDYQVSLTEVSDRGSALRESLEGYSLRIGVQ